MKLLLSGRWPPLKPLPVFKYETDEYRAAIEFDKLRGEWVCRKTSLLSNKVKELRGGLAEITMALPRGREEAVAECGPAEQPEQELEKDVSRRREAILEWREKHESGALYSGLQGYLSKSQQDEIADSIRLTLTARQLQFNPKNVADVFEALSKAGGRLATLIEAAQRNKSEQGTEQPEKAKAAAAGASPDGIACEEPAPHLADFAPAPLQNVLPGILESDPEDAIWRVVPEHEQHSAPELLARAAPRESELAAPEISEEIPPESGEELPMKAGRYASGAVFGQHLRARKIEPSADRSEASPSRSFVLELSPLHIAAGIILFAAISLGVLLTAGRRASGSRPQEPEKSSSETDHASQALLNRQREPIPRSFTAPEPDTSVTTEANPPAPAAAESHTEIPAAQSFNAPAEEPAARAAPVESSSATTSPSLPEPEKLEAPPERNASAGPVARNAPPPADSRAADSRPTDSRSAHSSRAVVPKSAAAASSAPRRAMPAPRATPHASSPSTVLFTGSGDGGKPFRLTLPEKPIAASASFAISSQLSVLVFPERGLPPAREPARLQAGELVSFVWPRYPGPGDRHAAPETVKVRTTIGELGQVLDVKRVSGSLSLLPAAASAIRMWRYKPTLVNQKPVQAQQDVTIEFRPPPHAARRMNTR